MRALLAPVLLLLTTTGAALAAPVPVLALSSDAALVTRPLGDGDPFTSSYIQSIYRAPVTEELERRGDALHLVRVRSTDRRAVEYFRWSGEIRDEDGAYVEEAPPYDTNELLIRTTAPYDQRISATGWSVPLAGRFGDETRVSVRAATVTRLVALLTAR